MRPVVADAELRSQLNYCQYFETGPNKFIRAFSFLEGASDCTYLLLYNRTTKERGGREGRRVHSSKMKNGPSQNTRFPPPLAFTLPEVLGLFLASDLVTTFWSPSIDRNQRDFHSRANYHKDNLIH